MRGRTHGERKLNNPAVNEISTPTETPSIPSSGPAGDSTAAGPAHSDDERSVTTRDARTIARLVRWYYGLKYRAFRGERRPRDGRRGLVVLQIDALAYADLRRAIELGYCPTITKMVHDEGYVLRHWFCGLPSATPYCQAGIFHG